MKFLSQCFFGGGASVTPAAEDTGLSLSSSSKTRQQQEGKTGRRNCRGGISRAAPADGFRTVKSANSSRNWKPKLQVISEDNVVMPRESYRAVGSDEKLPPKVKAKSRPKAPPVTHGDDYWKSSYLWAMPVFSPTPFSF